MANEVQSALMFLRSLWDVLPGPFVRIFAVYFLLCSVFAFKKNLTPNG